MLARGADRHSGDRRVGPVGQPPVEGVGLVVAEYISGPDRDVGDGAAVHRHLHLHLHRPVALPAAGPGDLSSPSTELNMVVRWSSARAAEAVRRTPSGLTMTGKPAWQTLTYELGARPVAASLTETWGWSSPSAERGVIVLGLMPWSSARAVHAETHSAPVRFKTEPLLRWCTCCTDGRRSSRCCQVSSPGECPRRRTEPPGTRRRTRLSRPRYRCCCSRCTWRTDRRRRSRCCELGPAGQCP